MSPDTQKVKQKGEQPSTDVITISEYSTEILP